MRICRNSNLLISFYILYLKIVRNQVEMLQWNKTCIKNINNLSDLKFFFFENFLFLETNVYTYMSQIFIFSLCSRV